MLASFIQFSFLCAVALANICLGFVIASRLGLGPSIAAFFELRQHSAMGTAGPEDAINPAEFVTEQVSTVAPDHSENPPTAEVETAEQPVALTEDGPAADESTAVASDDISLKEDDNPVECILTLIQEHAELLKNLQPRLADDGAAPSPSDAEAASEQLTEIVQGLLQKLNTSSDRVRQSEGEANETDTAQVMAQTSELWSQINDSLVQLVELSYDETSLSDSVTTLRTTIDEILGHCESTQNQLEACMASA